MHNYRASFRRERERERERGWVIGVLWRKGGKSGGSILPKLQSNLASIPLAVNSRDKHSRTPLHLAAWAGQVQVVSYLCKQKADVGAAVMDDMGAIHFAVLHPRRDI